MCVYLSQLFSSWHKEKRCYVKLTSHFLKLEINKNLVMLLFVITPTFCTWTLLFCLLAAVLGRQDDVWCVKLQAGASQSP
jgi:hypothetical protein